MWLSLMGKFFEGPDHAIESVTFVSKFDESLPNIQMSLNCIVTAVTEALQRKAERMEQGHHPSSEKR